MIMLLVDNLISVFSTWKGNVNSRKLDFFLEMLQQHLQKQKMLSSIMICLTFCELFLVVAFRILLGLIKPFYVLNQFVYF